jgi:hypothetical protein
MGGIVDIQALRGFDSPDRAARKAKLLFQNPDKFCQDPSCNVKLSKYNSSDYCSQHQKNHIPLKDFI